MTGLNVLLSLPTLVVVCILFYFLTLRRQVLGSIEYYYSGIAGTDRILAIVLFGLGQVVSAVGLNFLVLHQVSKWFLFSVLSFIVTLVVLRMEFAIYSSRNKPHPSEAYPREEFQ